MTETIYLLAGLWLGMGLACWVVPFWAALPSEGASWLDVISLPIVLALGPAAVVLYARHERENY